MTRIDESGTKCRVVFTGYIENVEDYYKVMDVCVHCSIEPEPFGLVITEAMLYGVPIIASDRGASKEIINQGITGYIVDPEDTVKLAETIVDLLSDEKLRNYIAEEARKHVIKTYNIESYKKDMQVVYTQALCVE